MTTNRQSSSLALLIVVLGLLACDPGFYYHPEGWKKRQGYEWTQRFDGIELTTSGLSGFVGSTGIIPDFDVTNTTDHIFVLQHAELLVEENSYAANIADKEAKWRTVEPHSSRSLTIYWEFDDVAVDVLGERPIAVLEFTVAGAARRIEITFTRAE
jgi:hypothetical protein